MIEGKTKQETIKLTAAALGISEIDAAFIYGQEHGTITGDVIMVKDGKPVDPPPKSELKYSRPIMALYRRYKGPVP